MEAKILHEILAEPNMLGNNFTIINCFGLKSYDCFTFQSQLTMTDVSQRAQIWAFFFFFLLHYTACGISFLTRD